jgi:hydrogenase 3 maturation protease
MNTRVGEMWQEALQSFHDKKTAIIGIGNTMRLDDAIGVFIVEKLGEMAKQLTGDTRLLILNGGITPEDCLPDILETKPQAVLLIDACDFGLIPGTIVILNEAHLPERFSSTHSLSPKVVGGMIKKFTGSAVSYMGIQAAQTGFGEGLSLSVQSSGKAIVRYFAEHFFN